MDTSDDCSSRDEKRINIPVFTKGFEELAEARVLWVREKAHVRKTYSAN